MNLLRDLIIEKKEEDLSRLPKDVMTSIKSNIRKGAEDLEQKWANALELVHKAYELDDVQRPDPSMETAWEQYEENLEYAVQQLASNRGMDGDWRMSSSIFREARKPRNKYKVILGDEERIVEARNFDEIVNTLEGQTTYDVLVEQNSSNESSQKFSRWSIRNNRAVTIRRIQ